VHIVCLIKNNYCWTSLDWCVPEKWI